ncbi:protein KES1 [Meredithblackwellia eburnea MCA 4105]
MSKLSEESEAVPHAQKQSWGAFLKSIASFSGDLSSLTAPPFILSPTSLCEFPAYWGESFEHFAAIASGKTTEERHLLVTTWFISTLAGQFTRREKETGSEKKPLNPVLGEQFIGEWNNGETTLVAEQVSHHPPITAYHLENSSKGVSFEGHCAQKTSFSGRTIVVKQVGHGIVRVNLPDGTVEKYLVTLPKLVIEGLWYGAPYVELSEHSYIQASHGLTTTIEYKGKGYFSGKSHTFTGLVGIGPSPKSPIYAVEGQWTGSSAFIKTGSKRVGEEFLNADVERVPITVKPIESQGEFESRKIWKDVADGIRSGDFEKASVAKSALENAERQKRKDELAEGVKFQTRLFDHNADDDEYRTLAAMCKHKPEHEESWTYKGKNAQVA